MNTTSAGARKGRLAYDKREPIYKKLWKSRTAYLFLLPLFTGLIIFGYYPPLSGIINSFFDWRVVAGKTFIGLDNYKNLFSDKVFLQSIPTMFKLMLPGLVIGITVPFITAEMIFAVKSGRLKYIYRVLILLPMVAPGIVSTLIWKYIYDPSYGLVTTLLRFVGILGETEVISWLYDVRTVIPAIIFMGFPWIGGTSVLIYMSGLMNISTEVIESSLLDGAGTLRRIFAIDIPLLLGQFKYFIVFGIIGGLQNYGVQVVLTQGGPGFHTYVPGYMMYVQAFSNGRMGYACAIGVVLFAVILAITVATYRFLKTDVEG